jgi:hypothetical protein
MPVRALTVVNAKLLNRRIANGRYRWNEDGELEKRCAQCHEYWPADGEFFFTGRHYPDGLHCYCKACYIERRWPDGRTGTLHETAPA